MLAMTNFGQNGRFGNQLFQYAFIRSQAEKLGVKMYIPAWIGDQAFDLQDVHIRCESFKNILRPFDEPIANCGFNSIKLEDDSDVNGYFQSEKMFNSNLIRRVYSFRPHIAAEGRALLGLDFDPSVDVALGIRLTDFEVLRTHYVPSFKYYRAALKRMTPRKIFLFSDDVARAEKLLHHTGFKGDTYSVVSSPMVKLAAMTNFRQFIIGPSTFHWWGAWLSVCPGKRVIAPLEGATRPGSPIRADDFWPEEWETFRALQWGDGYKVNMIKQSILRFWRLPRALYRRIGK